MPLLLLIAALLLPLAGCAASQRAAAPAQPRFFRGDTGAPANPDELLSSAAAADVVIIGENHGHPLGLSTAAALWYQLLARTDKAALSLEFFDRDDQSRLDDYLSGLTDESTFRSRTGRTDSSYPPGHREMVEAARAAGRPVIAANAPRVQVRTARLDGYDRLKSLTSAQQRLVRIPETLPEGRYRDDFNKVMTRPEASHGSAPAPDDERRRNLDAAFRSQSLWDWTMADSIATALASGSTPVVHVVGRFHSDFRGGLVQALERLRPGTRVVTISFIDDWSGTLRDEDRGRADVVIYVGPASRR